MSPPYLSKVEHGEFAPPAEKKVKAIAKELDLSADELLALAGRVAKDIRVIINKYPLDWTEVLRTARRGWEEGMILLKKPDGRWQIQELKKFDQVVLVKNPDGNWQIRELKKPNQDG
jgi:hypothetical protein